MSVHPDPAKFAALPQVVRFTCTTPDAPCTLGLKDGGEVLIPADAPLTLAPAGNSRMLIVYTPTRSGSTLYAIPPELAAAVESYVTPSTPPPTVAHVELAPDTVTLIFEGLQRLTLARAGLCIQGKGYEPHNPPPGPFMVLELFPPTWETEGYYRVQARKDTPEGRAALTTLGFAHHLKDTPHRRFTAAQEERV